jgi:hypothetical protein
VFVLLPLHINFELRTSEPERLSKLPEFHQGCLGYTKKRAQKARFCIYYSPKIMQKTPAKFA